MSFDHIVPDPREEREEQEAAVINALEAHGVGFIRIAHESAPTMEKCRGIGLEYKASHCKNLFLTNKRGTRFFLLMMDPDKPYRTSEVSKKLGSTRLSFAGEEALYDILGLRPGCVSAMGIVCPRAKEAYSAGALTLAADSELLKNERICVHPNTDRATFVLETAELLRFIKEMGYELVTVDIDRPESIGEENAN